MRAYNVTLSMGHDTSVYYSHELGAKTRHDAVLAVWKQMYNDPWYRRQIEEVYEKKQLRYFPYYFVEEALARPK